MSTKQQEPQLLMPHRDPRVVDAVLGKRRKHEFTPEQIRARKLAIAEAYPDWAMYHEQIAVERMNAYLESRKAHPATEPPVARQRMVKDPDFPGPSAAKIRQDYGSKD